MKIKFFTIKNLFLFFVFFFIITIKSSYDDINNFVLDPIKFTLVKKSFFSRLINKKNLFRFGAGFSILFYGYLSFSLLYSKYFRKKSRIFEYFPTIEYKHYGSQLLYSVMKLFSDTIDINKDFTVDYYAPCNSCEIEFYCEGPFPPYSLKFKSIYDVDCNRIFEEEIQQKNRECMKNGAIFIPYFYVQIINCLRKFKIGNDLTQSLSYKKLYETIYDMIFSDKENPLINFETLSDDVKYVLLNQKILNNSEYEESKKNYLYKENFSKEDLEKNVYQMITIIKKIYDKAYYEQYKENNIKNEIKMPGFGLRLSAGFFFTWVSYQLFKYH